MKHANVSSRQACFSSAFHDTAIVSILILVLSNSTYISMISKYVR